MKVKFLSRLIFSLIAIVLLFVLSYKITVKTRNDKYAQSTTTTTPSTTATSLPVQEKQAFDEPNIPVSSSYASLTELPTPIIVNISADETWSLTVLNVFYKMNDTYEPQVEAAIEGSDVYLDKRVAEKFREMYNAAVDDGITFDICGGYVSLERQNRKFNKLVSDYVSQGYSDNAAKLKASYSVLPAGCNEANYGLSVDIGWESQDFKSSPAYEWLMKNAADYGFIERYPDDKTEYTCFNSQPWHWRYVGVAYAREMVANNLCLEEYTDKVH